ncbi:Imm49 family immunity protein [Streptomyces goshikiensis]|uniref:immunity 49 family protein n=1 Tax=Streptomyces goshikiensis TaxID=1942 RepID=UPI003721F635
MRIERHQVGGEVVSAAREDFANRIIAKVRSMSRAGRMATYEWRLVSEDFLDHLGALSLETPDLATPEARAVLENAAEAAAGAVAYAAYHPNYPFHVYLDYVDHGVGYDPGSDAPAESVTAREWLDAFCLAVLAGKAAQHGEAFHFARQKAGWNDDGHPAGELVDAFMEYVVGSAGQAEKTAVLDAALARLGTPPQEDAALPALRALRAVATGDREAFRSELVTLLLRHKAAPGPGGGARPRGLLPLLPLALAALAWRAEGWEPEVDTGYLPRALVTGFRGEGPRVGPYGRGRRPDAAAALAAGPVTVERPGQAHPMHPEGEAWLESQTREAFTPVAGGEPLAAGPLGSAMRHQEMLFKARASYAADVTAGQAAGVRLASQLGAALFRAALADPGTVAEVTIDGVPVRYRAYRGHAAGPAAWQTAVSLALVTGAREDLAPLVLTGPAHAAEDRSAFASYRVALHDYLRGADPDPALDRALLACEKAAGPGFPPPPAVLLSQLVGGDGESFGLALLDALKAHRDHYLVADRAHCVDAALDLDVLALTCHARRRGWPVRVTSPYLPPLLLTAAQPL